MAVTADNTVFMESKHLDHEGMKVDFEVAATTVIYKNSFVGLNPTGYLTSYVAPAVYTGVTATGTKFVGIALEHIASQTSDGDARCSVLIDGYFVYTLTGATRIDVGTPVFASDNATLSMDGTAGVCIGYIVGPAGTNEALVKLLGPVGQFAGQMFSVISPLLNLDTLGSKVLLVHETQNPNGIAVCTCAGYTTEVHACATAQGVVTIQHTADTSMGITLTAVDNSDDKDLVVAGGAGCLWNPASASDDAVILAPAGTQINAEVTTASSENGATTGQIKVVATFICF